MLGQIQAAAVAKGWSDPFTLATRRLVSPVANPIRSLSFSTGDFFWGLFRARSIESENRRLKLEIQNLGMYQVQIDSLARQLDMLRAMQGFGPVPGKTRVPANVVGYFPSENLMTVNVGTDEGISPGCPVVTATGLLGTVQSVGPHSSQVLLITDVKRKIGAIDISRKPPPAGLLRGENSTTLDLMFQDPQSPVETGDVIVTSGFSDKIPRGIFIGRVIRVEDSPELGTRRAQVFPTVSIGETREVQVLR